VICARCQERIKAGEKYTKHDNPGASAAGSVVFLHVKPCKRPPTQTSPVRPRGR
jgi:hypothetical protein